MAKYTNISTGPRGGYLNGQLVMVEAGKEADLDDAPEEWFGKPGAKSDDGNGGKPEPATAEDITAAIDQLDAENDDHWTAAGAPAVDAVAELAGKPVTRAAITEAAPEAKRPAAE